MPSPLITEHRLTVRSTDMDADQIVNNARYFEYFEQVRLEHLVALHLFQRPRAPGESRRSFTLAETTCRYRAPLRHRDVIVGKAWTSMVGTRSFQLAYELSRESDGVVAAQGSSAQVWLDEDGRPAPLPDEVRASLVRSMGDEGSRSTALPE